MFVRPSLVSGLRSSWKSIEESPYFLLQEQNNNNSKRRRIPKYRIITRGFPHYKVAENDDLNQILESFDEVLPDILSEIEGKKTMKKILKKLKDWCSRELPSDEEDIDGYVTDASVTPEDGNSSGEIDDQDQDQDNYSLEVNVMRSSNSSYASTKSENPVAGDKGKSKITDRDLATQSPDQLDLNDSSDSNSYSSDADANNDGGADPEGVDGSIHVDEWWPSNLMYSLMDWLGGGPVGEVKAVSAKQTATAAANNLSNNKNETILDIPMQFVALLTYPEIDPKATKKSSFAVLREISFVKQRRKVLMMFTLYLFIMRMCSFDLFLVLLFASNCAMLFLMKNSGKVNVTMAKRAVRQRIGWAIQWAGSKFIRHRANTHPSNNNNNLTGGNGRKNNTSASTTHMVKSGSLDAIHSGSMSDTTYGGSVTRKVAPKRGGFFRNKGGQASTTSQTTKDNNNSERPVGTISVEPSSMLDSTQQEYSRSPLITPPLPPQAPTPLGGTPMQTSLSNQPQNLSTGIATEISHTPALTKRRFFPKRNHSSNNNNNSAATSQPNLSALPLHNGPNNHMLPDIVEHKPSSPSLPSNVYSTVLNSPEQNDTTNGILSNNETIVTANSNKVVSGTNSSNNGSVNNGHSTRLLPNVITSNGIGSNNNDNSNHNNNNNNNNGNNGSNNNTINSRIISRNSTGAFDTDFLNFDDPNELFSLADEVRSKKSIIYSRTVGHRKNNSGGFVNIGTHEIEHID